MVVLFGEKLIEVILCHLSDANNEPSQWRVKSQIDSLWCTCGSLIDMDVASTLVVPGSLAHSVGNCPQNGANGTCIEALEC